MVIYTEEKEHTTLRFNRRKKNRKLHIIENGNYLHHRKREIFMKTGGGCGMAWRCGGRVNGRRVLKVVEVEGMEVKGCGSLGVEAEGVWSRPSG
ncbi:hypothetical protein Hamer_G020325 [Homarus americanus]|uniref:Uncharacterized protein n=1 Tax=Homarus americanus TaxID=6706 RepID=A0A8J5N3C4_HOMAM|nr:hypothetical protein Hamer_G020325 [Homarus americanus]